MMHAIRFDHVSKQFTLERDRPQSFQELFLNLLHRSSAPRKEKFWALQDVSFHVDQGDAVGIVGANGVGKSTLLKLITRIIEPTSGQIEVNGQLGALLELGAGFHPDLTGRENIYLNGSILGFSRAQMNRIFDDIVDFSELERFIDVAVKHYSSGMYMRLAFSIAIHIEPDILIVDEVLAVGDEAFQHRCMDRIQEMKRKGVTIVLVTHSLEMVREMCNRAIWLDEGRLQVEGGVEQVLERYTAQILARDREQIMHAEQEKSGGEHRAPEGEAETADGPQRLGSREVEIVAVQILDGNGQEQRSFRTGDPLTLRMHYVAHQVILNPMFGLSIHHSSGFHVNGPNNVFAGYPIPEIHGAGWVDYRIESLPLLPATYLVTVAIHDQGGKHTYDYIHQGFTFRIRPGGTAEKYGAFSIPATWHWNPNATGPKPMPEPLLEEPSAQPRSIYG